MKTLWLWSLCRRVENRGDDAESDDEDAYVEPEAYPSVDKLPPGAPAHMVRTAGVGCTAVIATSIGVQRLGGSYRLAVRAQGDEKTLMRNRWQSVHTQRGRGRAWGTTGAGGPGTAIRALECVTSHRQCLCSSAQPSLWSCFYRSIQYRSDGELLDRRLRCLPKNSVMVNVLLSHHFSARCRFTVCPDCMSCLPIFAI